jgi:chorismate mutase
MFSVRGATTIFDDNKEEILHATRELLSEIIEKNLIDKEEIVSIIFSSTKDIKSLYPAQAARDLGIIYAGLMCLQEMYVDGSLEKCIRILLMANGDRSQREVKHIYLKEAKSLRPDLIDR